MSDFAIGEKFPVHHKSGTKVLRGGNPQEGAIKALAGWKGDRSSRINAIARKMGGVWVVSVGFRGRSDSLQLSHN